MEGFSMETIRERLRPETAQETNKPFLGKVIVFPRESISKFRDKQDELSYYISPNIRDEKSALFDSILG